MYLLYNLSRSEGEGWNPTPPPAKLPTLPTTADLKNYWKKMNNTQNINILFHYSENVFYMYFVIYWYQTMPTLAWILYTN